MFTIKREPDFDIKSPQTPIEMIGHAVSTGTLPLSSKLFGRIILIFGMFLFVRERVRVGHSRGQEL